MKPQPYSRRHYHSRGLRPQTDLIANSMRYRKCEVCGERYNRREKGDIGESGLPRSHAETWARFSIRRTCSKDCKKILLTGKGNPNYKGYMYTCKDCGKRIGYPMHSKGQKPNERCGECFKKWAHETGWYVRHAWQGIIPRAKQLGRKGTKHLAPYNFKKGMIAANRKFYTCQTEGCQRPHLARGMCAAHYSKWSVENGRRKLYEKICPYCYKRFSNIRKDSVYCSVRCADTFRNKGNIHA